MRGVILKAGHDGIAGKGKQLAAIRGPGGRAAAQRDVPVPLESRPFAAGGLIDVHVPQALREPVVPIAGGVLQGRHAHEFLGIGQGLQARVIGRAARWEIGGGDEGKDIGEIVGRVRILANPVHPAVAAGLILAGDTVDCGGEAVQQTKRFTVEIHIAARVQRGSAFKPGMVLVKESVVIVGPALLDHVGPRHLAVLHQRAVPVPVQIEDIESPVTPRHTQLPGHPVRGLFALEGIIIQRPVSRQVLLVEGSRAEE